MSTSQTKFTRSEATTLGNKCGELSRFRGESLGGGVTWTSDRESKADLVFLFHLIKNGPPYFAFPHVRGIAKYIHAVLGA
jgi:hypothetical protein